MNDTKNIINFKQLKIQINNFILIIVIDIYIIE